MNQQGSSPDADFALRRALIGLGSIGLMIAWVLTRYFGERATVDTVAPILMRMGLVTGALWLALPELHGLFKNMSGKGTLLMLVALVVAGISKASVVPLTVLGVGMLVAFGLRRAWQWLWDPLSTPASKAPAASKSPADASDNDQRSRGP
jgi:hypothetical protein